MSESVVRVVHVEDGVQSPLELLPVLAPERMAELLATELAAQGFVRDAGGTTMTRTDPDGIIITVDLAAATVAVKLGADANVNETIELVARVAEETQVAAEQRLRGTAQGEIDRRVAERTEQLRREVTQTLESKLGELRGELDGAIGRATVAALTERAQQLGEIQELVADAAGNVTIKVKL